MKINALIIPAILMGLCSCTQPSKKLKPAIYNDTLTYQYKTYKKRADNCGSKPDSGCTVLKITYPVFNEQAALNDSLKLKLIGLFSIGDKADTSLATLTTNFMKAYQADLKTTNRKTMFYILDNKASIIRQDSALTTLQVDGNSYLGGAHGQSYIGFVNWQTITNKNLELKDIMVDGYETVLNKVAEKIFRKQENLSDTSSLKADYFFKDAKFSLNNNFLISPLGLRFVYNPYEIKPYAAGTTDLLVPYEQIKTLLRPHTVVAQYLK